MKTIGFFTAMLALCLSSAILAAAPLTDSQKAKVQTALTQFQLLGSDPQVVDAVKAANSQPPAAYKGMTQDTWAALTLLSPEVKYFSQNDLAKYLKTKRTEIVTELFVSAADGTKVAFFAKTSNWSHKGKPKHDLPMAGKTWIGETEQDASTGKVQVQISFPVLDGQKAIGSIVIGLDLTKL